MEKCHTDSGTEALITRSSGRVRMPRQATEHCVDVLWFVYLRRRSQVSEPRLDPGEGREREQRDSVSGRALGKGQEFTQGQTRCSQAGAEPYDGEKKQACMKL